MIRHIVIIHFIKDPERDYSTLLKQTKPLIKKIPGVKKYEIFPNKSKYTPEDVTSFGVEIHFQDEEALDVFMKHPKHTEANELFEKFLADPPYMVLTHDVKK